MDAPLKVMFASVHAGGGHNTVRDALVRAVRTGDPRGDRVVPTSFTCENEFDRAYRWCVKHGLQGFVYAMSAFSLATWVAMLTNLPMLFEAIGVLRRERPDVVVSTHLVLTTMFKVARVLVSPSTVVVNVIPDYGPANHGFFPRFPALRADATLVNGEDTLASLADRARPNEVFLLGTLAPPGFEALAADCAEGRHRSEFKASLKARLVAHEPGLAPLELSRPTLTVLGGSGFGRHALPVVQALLQRRPDLEANIVVLAGRDEALRHELAQLYGGKVLTVGFLPQELLACLYALTDVPLLGSLAHSTLTELLELGVGPLLIAHLIPGTEPPYLPYLHGHRLGLYEPRPEAMSVLVEQALEGTPGPWSALALGYVGRAQAIRARSRERATRLVSQLVAISGRETAGEAIREAA